MKKYIKKLIRENLLQEYINQNMVSLKKYFSMTDEQKKSYLPYEYPYEFDRFKEEEGIDLDIDAESYEISDILHNKNPELYNRFAEWLFKEIENYSLNVPDADYPAWSFFTEADIVKNQWLIHFTDDAVSIAGEGFKYGVDEMEKLGLTTHFGEFEKKYGGYNFAFLLSDFRKYGYKGYNNYKYGKDAVIFRASGLAVWHYSDEEPQVIFYGNTAKDIIPITKNSDDEWYIYGGKRGVLYKNDDLEKVVEWFVNNYTQYRKQYR